MATPNEIGPTQDQLELFYDLAYEKMVYIWGTEPAERVLRAQMIGVGLTKTTISSQIHTLLNCDDDPKISALERSERKKARYARRNQRQEQADEVARAAEKARQEREAAQAPSYSQDRMDRQLLELAQSALTEKKFYTINGDNDANGVDHIYTVRRSRQTRRLYALRLNKDLKKWELNDGSTLPYDQQFTRWLVRNLGSSELLTVEKAARIGLNLNWCIVCSTPLSADLSAKVGIGPVCIKTLGSHVTQRDLYNQMISSGAIQR